MLTTVRKLFQIVLNKKDIGFCIVSIFVNCSMTEFYDGVLCSIRSLSCRNQPTDLLCKSMDLFLYDKDLRHERVN